ncbi:MAG: hypothetical protein KDC35_21030 [Acidobacteria bacterium]|nr:hypothetical protein [Acidobacteriota bacterium]
MSKLRELISEVSGSFDPKTHLKIVDLVKSETNVSELRKIASENFGDPDILEVLCTRVLALVPDHISTTIDLGWSYWFQNEKQKGLECLKQSKTALTKEIVRYIELIAAFEENDEDRISLFNYILELDPENKAAAKNLAWNLSRRK